MISFCIAAVSIPVCHTCSPLGVMLLYAVAFAVAVAVAVADTLRMLSILLFGVLILDVRFACFQFDHVFCCK